MERQRVVQILKFLASGIDPATGEPANAAFGQPEVIRALFTAADLITTSAAQATEPAASQRPAAAGLPWTEDEDARLRDEFDSGLSVAEIARKHGRSKGGITSRLVKVGKLDAAAVRTRERFVPVERPGVSGNN